MRSAKKNILSSWKARKERLSETPRKPRRGKERSWRNSVMAKRFSSLRQKKEIKIYKRGGFIPNDYQIYEKLCSIEFEFGKETHTVEEAKLLFSYEIGLDLFQVYVIALSECFGAILFHLPEDLAEMIARRAESVEEEFSDYLSRIIEEKADVRRMNERISSYGIDADAAGEALIQLSKEMSEVIEQPIDRRVRSNNWLRLRGLLMRRKGKGKRRNE